MLQFVHIMILRNDINNLNSGGSKMLCLWYPNCVTCQSAKKWLDAKGIEYEIRDIKTQNLTYEELKEWHEKSGLPLKRFLNASGMIYKVQGLKDKVLHMSEDDQDNLIATNGMLVKRPILVWYDIHFAGLRTIICDE